MPSFFFFIIYCFLLLSCAPRPLSCTSIVSRRILHQPFFPQDSLSPSQSPSPSPPAPPTTTTPKIPFSSTSTPTNSPFFPSYPVSPPPPSPATFASFPANISSLILPQTQKPKPKSQKLLIIAISAVISATVVAGILVFFYCRRRWQNRNFADDSKTFTSDNSHRVYPPPNAVTRSSSNKLRTTSSTSSEFLYLGTLVNSRSINESSNSDNNGGNNAGSDSRKLESPELRPLPPLSRQSFRQNCEVGSVGEEEEEEFYSPRVSLGGRESSSGTGSGSRRAFAAVAGEEFEVRTSEPSTCSCSSSSSGSPARSLSISISPPVSLNPRRSEPKPTESSVAVQATPPPASLPPQRNSPERVLQRNSDASPRISNVSNRNTRSPSLSLASISPDRGLVMKRSPSLSLASISPDRGLVMNPDASLRISNVSDRNTRSSSLSLASTSPDRGLVMNPDASPRISNVSDRKTRSPSLSLASTSPDRGLVMNPDASPRINVRSPLLSSASTSPDRGLEKNPGISPRILNDLDRNVQSTLQSSASTSPDRGLEKTPDAYFRILKDLDRNVQSPLHSSASTSPDASPRILNDFNRNVQSSMLTSASTSPEREPDASPGIYSDRNGRSPSLSSSASSSPNRVPDKSPAASPVVWDRNRQSSLSSSLSSSLERGLENSPDASLRAWNGSDQNVQFPVATSSALKHPISVPPPPPPPPPPPFPQGLWENPNPSTSIGQPISKPPPLIPPSRPFVIQNPAKVSPMELPPSSVEPIEEAQKPKLKPLHWDKVRASSDREMVWDHLRSSSFKLNEEMIETLFVVNTPNSKPKQATPRPVLPSSNQENRVLDPKKAQNIAILLRAVNVTIEEVCEALLEGNADTLGTELLEHLLKMAPTKEEERKLKEYKDDSPIKLGPAEKFLKSVLDVPFAFQRVDAMLYITNFESEVEYLKRSFETLEAACEELRNSRMFLKLLEAVLKTGNRMNVGTNRGDAQAFKLDTLLKLVDVKGADGKTTLLHFVVQEIIRAEGARLSGTSQATTSTLSEDAKCRKLGLQVVSSLSSELTNVKKAAAMDSEVLSGDVSKLSRGTGNINEVVRLNETMGLDESSQRFSESMNRFMKMAEEEIIRIQAQESVALSLVKEITEYFHGNSAKEEAHPFRIFLVVRDFLTILDRVCKEVGKINERTIVSSAHKFPVPVNPMMPQGFPGFHGRRQHSSSDDESTSP